MTTTEIPPELQDKVLTLADVLREELVYVEDYRQSVGLASEQQHSEKLSEKSDVRQCQDAMFASEAAALCLSGGGIRSATFNLGVLQSLAKLGLLRRFDFISSVSGGGYIAGWLSTWAFRAGGIQNVEDELKRGNPEGVLADRNAKESPVQWLRDFSNYLTPKVGLLSVDSWTLIATYIRNLLVIWLAVVPPLMTLLAVPLLAFGLLKWTMGGPGRQEVCTWILTVGGVVLMAIGEYCSCRLKNYEPLRAATGVTPAKSYFKCVNLTFALGVLVFVCGWIISQAAPDTWWIAPVVAGAFIVIAALLGLYMEWPERGSHPHAYIGYMKYDVVAIFVQMVVTVLTTALFFALTWTPRAGSGAESWQLVIFPFAFLYALLIGDLVYVAFLSRKATDEDRERWARSGAWFAILALIWVAWSGLQLIAPGFLWDRSTPLLGPHAAAAAASALLAIILARAGLSTRSSAVGAERPKFTQKVLVPAGMIVFAVLVLALLASANAWLEMYLARQSVAIGALEVPSVAAFGVILSLVAIALLVLRFVNVNVFSLHAMYRDRLIRAYLGATRDSHRTGKTRFATVPNEMLVFQDARYEQQWTSQAERRNANPYTGFDDADNPDLFWLGIHRTQPLWTVNVALNLVDDRQRLSWQERKAASFTTSPLHAGSWLTGYRRTIWYGSRRGGISAGTAIAISGAAANPNMGYHSSAALTFLMTLFNVRLGWWLGNPRTGRAARTLVRSAVEKLRPLNERMGSALASRRRQVKTSILQRQVSRLETLSRCFAAWLEGPRLAWTRPPHRERGPQSGLFHLLAEMFGKTNDRGPWLHLSDGGHFENLGLYEMVLRHCKYIVVCDASADPDRHFECLGNAIRKIRTDLDVRIEPADGAEWCIGARGQNPCASHAMFDVKYGDHEAQWGRLIYIKPSVYDADADLPKDVRQYSNSSFLFPHETTVDQFFGESQFESYRALGEHQVARRVLWGLDTARVELLGMATVFEKAHRNLQSGTK